MGLILRMCVHVLVPLYIFWAYTGYGGLGEEHQQDD